MSDIKCDAFIGGRWVAGDKRFAVTDPFDGAVVAQVTEATEAMVDSAVAAAVTAFPGWKKTTGPARSALLRKVADRMLAEERSLAELCTRENGKPIKESIAEVRYAASFLSWFGGEAERIYGEVIPASRPEQHLVAVREPVGPVAVVTPWNFPYAMLTRKLGAALASGCTVVAKPAELTPLGTLAIAEICDAVGIPPGVFNVVPTTRAKDIGGRLLAHPSIRKISFTGSTAVGQLIARNAADDLKRVSLELGGNGPFVVLADADLDAAVAGALIAKFRNSGQTCVAANRFILEAPIADVFTQKLVAAVAKLVTGRGSDPTTDVGPVIDDRAVAKIRGLVEDAIQRGATLLLGSVPDGARLIRPIVLSGITAEMALWKTEVFGPVIGLRTAATEDDAIVQANDTDAGLIAYVYTRDGARQQRMAAAIEAGMIGINEGLVSTAQAPFGGIKHSGIGREGSRHGIDDYTNWKYIATRIG